MDRWNPWAQPTQTLEITQLYRQIKQGGPYKIEVIARLFLFLSSLFQPDKKENLNKNLDEKKHCISYISEFLWSRGYLDFMTTTTGLRLYKNH